MNKILLIIATIPAFAIAILLILNVVVDLELETEIEFEAPREKVWQVLIDNDKYSEWNPFIVSSEGTIMQGNRITNVMMNRGQETTFNPVIKILDDFERLEWLGTGMSGMFKGRHYFILTDSEGGNTKMVHGERFTGFLAGLIILIIGEDTRANFEAMNEAMAERVKVVDTLEAEPVGEEEDGPDQ